MSGKRTVKRSNSPDAFKAIRSSSSIESTASDGTAPPIIGRHSDKRAIIRQSKEELPLESALIVEKLMNVKAPIIFYYFNTITFVKSIWFRILIQKEAGGFHLLGFLLLIDVSI
jgi:hypothetical protein